MGGDLMVVPDMNAEARADFGDGSQPEHFAFRRTASRRPGTPKWTPGAPDGKLSGPNRP
jgi:hypothetical protein